MHWNAYTDYQIIGKENSQAFWTNFWAYLTEAYLCCMMMQLSLQLASTREDITKATMELKQVTTELVWFDYQFSWNQIVGCA